MRRCLFAKIGLCWLAVGLVQPASWAKDATWGGPYPGYPSGPSEANVGWGYKRDWIDGIGYGTWAQFDPFVIVDEPYWSPSGAPDPFVINDVDEADNVERMSRSFEYEKELRRYGISNEHLRIDDRAWPGLAKAQENGWVDDSGRFKVAEVQWNDSHSMHFDYVYYHIEKDEWVFTVSTNGLSVGNWPTPTRYLQKRVRIYWFTADPEPTEYEETNSIQAADLYDYFTDNFTFVGFRLKVSYPSYKRCEEEWGVSEGYLYDQPSAIPQYKWAFIDNAACRWRWGHRASDPGDDQWITVGRINSRGGGLESISPKARLIPFTSWEEPNGTGTDYLWYSSGSCTVLLQHE